MQILKMIGRDDDADIQNKTAVRYVPTMLNHQYNVFSYTKVDLKLQNLCNILNFIVLKIKIFV